MATDAVRDSIGPDRAAELTSLGKRLEILRIERGLSKQKLARHAGTSRQQLWRVMTGKSELTSSLRERLATALCVESTTLVTTQTHASPTATTLAFSPSTSGLALTVTDYLTDPGHLALTLRTLPSGDGGRRLKRALLNALEDLSVEAGRSLPIDYSEIHRRVLAGEI